MNVILLKALVALIPVCLLFCGSGILFLVLYSYLVPDGWWWSFLLMSPKRFICLLGWTGALSIALDIIWTSVVRFSVSRCFP